MDELNKHETPNRGIIKNLKSTYKYAKNGRKYLFLFFLTNILLTVISVIVPVLSAKRLLALTNGTFEKLLVFIFLIFLVEITRNIGNYVSVNIYNNFYYGIRKNFQIELTRETLKLTENELNTNSSGVFIERINNDTDNLTDIFTDLIDYSTFIVGNIGILIAVFLINIYQNTYSKVSYIPNTSAKKS